MAVGRVVVRRTCVYSTHTTHWGKQRKETWADWFSSALASALKRRNQRGLNRFRSESKFNWYRLMYPHIKCSKMIMFCMMRWIREVKHIQTTIQQQWRVQQYNTYQQTTPTHNTTTTQQHSTLNTRMWNLHTQPAQAPKPKPRWDNTVIKKKFETGQDKSVDTNMKHDRGKHKPGRICYTQWVPFKYKCTTYNNTQQDSDDTCCSLTPSLSRLPIIARPRKGTMGHTVINITRENNRALLRVGGTLSIRVRKGCMTLLKEK